SLTFLSLALYQTFWTIGELRFAARYEGLTSERALVDRSFSVIVPVYNEAGLVAESLEQIDDFMTTWCPHYEILVVESGSTDGGAQLCDEVAERRPHVRVIHENVRTGYGSALQLAFRKAAGTH